MKKYVYKKPGPIFNKLGRSAHFQRKIQLLFHKGDLGDEQGHVADGVEASKHHQSVDRGLFVLEEESFN